MYFKIVLGTEFEKMIGQVVIRISNKNILLKVMQHFHCSHSTNVALKRKKIFSMSWNEPIHNYNPTLTFTNLRPNEQNSTLLKRKLTFITNLTEKLTKQKIAMKNQCSMRLQSISVLSRNLYKD
jgi:adenine C2-methylase RlmN of 23S rRNA A2503 and tRNA A37